MHKLVVSLVVSSCFFAPVSAKDVLVSSPDGAVTVAVGVKANRPYYTVSRQGQTVISPSHLGSVVFRVFNDGVGFLYVLHRNKGEKYCIQDELTEITLAHDAKAWSIPTNHTEYFEGIYTPDLLSRKDTVCTPLTIEYLKPYPDFNIAW